MASLGIRPLITREDRLNQTDLPESALTNNLRDPGGLRMAAVHESLHEEDTGLPNGKEGSLSLRGIQRQGLLA